jgi:uncharacterized protein involved in exopolysaccharide biosynthesis
MTSDEWQSNNEASLFAIGTALLQNRRRIAAWVIMVGLLGGIWVYAKPRLYLASASFIQQGTDPARAGLATLAGQFGVAVAPGSQSLSPDFYSKLLTSRVLLLPIARDTFAVQELGGKRVSFADLFEIQGETIARREEKGVARLREIISVSIAKSTGVVELSVGTKWRSVSLAIATELIDGVNKYNERMRQSQAGAERQFVEGRLIVAGSELRAAEDRLQSFLQTNREFGSSPQLSFERDRLQRALMLQQQVFTSLKQAYEDARIREVRDTPVITIFEPPSASSIPQSRGGIKTVLFALLLGGLVGISCVYLPWAVARRRESGDTSVDEFLRTLTEARRAILRGVMWRKRPASAGQ